MKNWHINSLAHCLLVFTLLACSSPKEQEPVVNESLPTLSGQLLFHRYSSYDNLDAQLYLYDFASKKLSCLSSQWKTVYHSMNGHFSPDGKSIVFMGIGTSSQSWDLFLHRIGETGEPELLFANSVSREEDPKFSPDGKMIVFKRSGQLYLYHLSDKSVSALSNMPANEYSMPYFSADGLQVICSKGAGNSASLVKFDVVTKVESPLYDRGGVVDYYPITFDANSYLFTSNYSASNANDQVYLGNYNNQAQRLPFNSPNTNYSDPYPVVGNWIVISATLGNSVGGYDLYFANIKTGELISLQQTSFEINQSIHELGAAYFNVPNF